MLILFLLFFQDLKPELAEAADIQAHNQEDTVNLRIYLTDGERVDLIQAQLQGLEPLNFEFKAEKERITLSLLQITRIEKVPDTTGHYKVWFDTGETQTGKIDNLEFISEQMTGVLNPHPIRLYEVERVQIFAGPRLRHCSNGHYEAVTPYPLCPICGNPLLSGSQDDEPEDEQTMRDRTHLLRLDGR